MMHSIISMAKTTLAVPALMLALALPVTQAHASQSSNGAKSMKVTVAGKGSARFDWMDGGERDDRLTEAKAMTRAVYGRGKWVCSPAGFGRQASCSRR